MPGVTAQGAFLGIFSALYKPIYINVFLGWINSAFLFKFNLGP